jgi:hypothetical protein
MKRSLLLSCIFVVGIVLFSCRQEKEAEPAQETQETQEKTKEDKGILERAGEETDEEVNEEVDKQIDKIGGEN